MTTKTKIINLDEIRNPTPVELIVDGAKHKMKEATVADFIENMKAIDSIGVNATASQEVEVMIGIVLRAFPTLKAEQVRKWTFKQLRTLAETARGANSEIVSDDEEEITEAKKSGNAQKAD